MGRLELGRERVVVSGGASGIGKAIAQLFLEEGAKVVVADISLRAAGSDGEGVAGPWFACSAVTGDVRSMADAGRIVQRAVDGHGGLDILVQVMPVPPA